ncbi:MAG: DUF1993 domain-containing protein [Myxococcota bacterium]
MALTGVDVAMGSFLRGLVQLDAILVKAEHHATASGIDPATLMGARLADDMYDLAAQVRWAVDATTITVARLTGEPPTLAGEVATFLTLHARIAAGIQALRAVPVEALEAGLGREITIAHRGSSTTYTGASFLTAFAIPTFYFHLTCAYAILRARGVPLTKGDYLGP